MDRRDFLKICAASASAAALSSCELNRGEDNEVSGAKEMTCRTDPKTGRKVSLLGYGCMRWPKTMDEVTGQEVPDQNEANRLVDKAIEEGITYFDTAPSYNGGLNEVVTGNALARHPRDKWTIATKLSNFHKESWSRKESMKLYHDSMEKLQVDTIDYYLLHAIGDRFGQDDFQSRFIDNSMLDFLVKEREEGRIINLGFSFHGSREAFDRAIALHDKYHWDFVQIQMNYLDWNHAGRLNHIMCNASYMYDRLHSLGIPVIIMEPLLGGQLAMLSPGHAQRLAHFDPKGTPASWAFRFCATFPDVLTVLSGMTYMDHLEENLRTFSPLKPLSDKETEVLLDIGDTLASYPKVTCTGCEYCMPCPYGVDIPSLLKHFNRCVDEGMILIDQRDVDYNRLRRRFVASYDKAVHYSRQADKCIGCGQCKPKCPQQIDIPVQLRRLDVLAEYLRRNS